MPKKLLIIACGALSWEIEWLRKANDWNSLNVKCIDAELHNYPDQIPGRVESMLKKYAKAYSQIFVAYADCGTGGRLDSLLTRWGIERLPGAHCYEVFSTSPMFNKLMETEPGTFYLTDFLVRHFDRLILQGLKLEQHPELLKLFFGRYTKLIYLAQTEDKQLTKQAKRAAKKLNLNFERLWTGMGDLHTGLSTQILRLDGQGG